MALWKVETLLAGFEVDLGWKVSWKMDLEGGSKRAESLSIWWQSEIQFMVLWKQCGQDNCRRFFFNEQTTYQTAAHKVYYIHKLIGERWMDCVKRSLKKIYFLTFFICFFSAGSAAISLSCLSPSPKEIWKLTYFMFLSGKVFLPSLPSFYSMPESPWRDEDGPQRVTKKKGWNERQVGCSLSNCWALE